MTGGTGYIGSHTVVELQKNGYDVIIADNLVNSSLDVLDGIEKITEYVPSLKKLILQIGKLHGISLPDIQIYRQ